MRQTLGSEPVLCGVYRKDNDVMYYLNALFSLKLSHSFVITAFKYIKSLQQLQQFNFLCCCAKWDPGFRTLYGGAKLFYCATWVALTMNSLRYKQLSNSLRLDR